MVAANRRGYLYRSNKPKTRSRHLASLMRPNARHHACFAADALTWIRKDKASRCHKRTPFSFLVSCSKASPLSNRPSAQNIHEPPSRFSHLISLQAGLSRKGINIRRHCEVAAFLQVIDSLSGCIFLEMPSGAKPNALLPKILGYFLCITFVLRFY